MKYISLILLCAAFGFGQSFTVSRADDIAVAPNGEGVQQIERVEIRTYSSDKHYRLQIACTLRETARMDIEIHSDSRLFPYQPSPDVSALFKDGVNIVLAWDNDRAEADTWTLSPDFQNLSRTMKADAPWWREKLTTHSQLRVSLPHPDSSTPNVQTFNIHGIGEEMSKHEECQ